jgi:broad specificity phosphatase PhoE
MTTLLLIRHGLSVTNNSGSFTGHLDAPLHERGHAQAQDLMRYLTTQTQFKIDKIYSSSSSRAYHTVLPTANALGLQVITSDLLKEINVGYWGGMTFEEIEKQYPNDWKLYREHLELSRYGNGETALESQARFVSAVEQIAKENDGKTVIITAHGGVLRLLYCAWKNIPLSQLRSVEIAANAALSIATFENGKGAFQETNLHHYLSDVTHPAKVF